MFVDEIREIVEAMLRRVPSLSPRAVWDADTDITLKKHDHRSIFARTVVDESFATACLSGLHQWNDQLTVAHTLAMSDAVPPSIAKATLDYWHGIMHRREPDYPNAKYWFRRVGEHPLFPSVLDAAQSACAGLRDSDDEQLVALVGAAKWNPFLFVDLCERYALDESATADAVRRIQAREMSLLLDFSANQAVTVR